MENKQGALLFMSSGHGLLSPKLPGDVGYDLPASEEVFIQPGGFGTIPTGICVELPEGVWAMIVARSSTNRSGSLLALPGVIDNGYRGELFVMVYNLGKHMVHIRPGMRVGQLILFPMQVYPLLQVDSLSESHRGTNGFGSTGA